MLFTVASSHDHFTKSFTTNQCAFMISLAQLVCTQIKEREKN